MSLSNSCAVEQGNSGISLPVALAAGLKALVLWCALMGATIVAGMLNPVDLPAGQQDGPLTSMQALLVVNGVVAGILATLAGLSRVGGWRLALLLFVSLFAVTTAMMQLETLWFNESLKLPLRVVGELTLNAAVVAAVVALIAMCLYRPRQAMLAPLPDGVVWRVGAMAVIYVFLYYGAGFFIAWQSADVRAYYENGIHIAFLPTVGFQLVRGTLWAVIALYIGRHLHGSLTVRALVLGGTFSVLTAAQLLYPAPFFPWAVREAHFIEIASSEFVYGLIAALLLLGGRASNPVSSASHPAAV